MPNHYLEFVALFYPPNELSSPKNNTSSHTSITPNTTIALLASNNKYVSDRSNNTIMATAGEFRNWEKFHIVDAGGGKIALKTHFNTYLSDRQNGKLETKEKLGNWEKFTVVDLGNGMVAFKSTSSGKYISNRQNEGNQIKVSSNKIGNWEKFKVIKVQ